MPTTVKIHNKSKNGPSIREVQEGMLAIYNEVINKYPFVQFRPDGAPKVGTPADEEFCSRYAEMRKNRINGVEKTKVQMYDHARIHLRETLARARQQLQQAQSHPLAAVVAGTV